MEKDGGDACCVLSPEQFLSRTEGWVGGPLNSFFPIARGCKRGGEGREPFRIKISVCRKTHSTPFQFSRVSAPTTSFPFSPPHTHIFFLGLSVGGAAAAKNFTFDCSPNGVHTTYMYMHMHQNQSNFC